MSRSVGDGCDIRLSEEAGSRLELSILTPEVHARVPADGKERHIVHYDPLWLDFVVWMKPLISPSHVPFGGGFII